MSRPALSLPAAWKVQATFLYASNAIPLLNIRVQVQGETHVRQRTVQLPDHADGEQLNALAQYAQRRLNRAVSSGTAQERQKALSRELASLSGLPADGWPERRNEQDLETLKRNWLADGCWDLWDTEGFELHEDELRAWYDAWRAKQEQADQERASAGVQALIQQHAVSEDVAAQLWALSERQAWRQQQAEDTLRTLLRMAGLQDQGGELDDALHSAVRAVSTLAAEQALSLMLSADRAASRPAVTGDSAAPAPPAAGVQAALRADIQMLKDQGTAQPGQESPAQDALTWARRTRLQHLQSALYYAERADEAGEQLRALSGNQKQTEPSRSADEKISAALALAAEWRSKGQPRGSFLDNRAGDAEYQRLQIFVQCGEQLEAILAPPGEAG